MRSTSCFSFSFPFKKYNFVKQNLILKNHRNLATIKIIDSLLNPNHIKTEKLKYKIKSKQLLCFYLAGDAAGMFSSLFLLLSLLIPTLMLEFRYHDNREIEQYLLQVSADNPDITHLYSIGKSVKGNGSRTHSSENPQILETSSKNGNNFWFQELKR